MLSPCAMSTSPVNAPSRSSICLDVMRNSFKTWTPNKLMGAVAACKTPPIWLHGFGKVRRVSASTRQSNATAEGACSQTLRLWMNRVVGVMITYGGGGFHTKGSMYGG